MNTNAELIDLARRVTEDGEAAVKYAAHLAELLEAVEPLKIGKDFAAAMQTGAYTAACRALAAYYRGREKNRLPEHRAEGEFDLEVAERAVQGRITVVGREWCFPDGEVDYYFDPTLAQPPRDHEWVWQHNRHVYWTHLACAYRQTGDKKYALAFERQLLKWIAQTDAGEGYNDEGSAWRTIECGIRLRGSWQVAFDGFSGAAEVSDVTLLLMIASMLRQARHLLLHYTKNNWIMLEMDGVYTYSVLFSELREAQAFRQAAIGHLLRELSWQILPDGMHHELSPDYQHVVLYCVANTCALAKAYGFEGELPESYTALIKKTIDAALWLSTPAMTQPATNDTYMVHTDVFAAWGERLFGSLPSYAFVRSGRTAGAPPTGNPSCFFDYAGFAVMRESWRADSAYLCFDVGPLGLSHIHQDMLNIILYKGDEELLFDDGGGAYDISDVREYSIASFGHNTVLVDGQGQSRKSPRRVTEPIDAGFISTPDYDYARGVYDGTYGDLKVPPAVHKREVRFCKPDFFCVCDTLTAVDGPLRALHDYEVRFHLDTLRVQPLAAYPNAVLSDFGRKYELAIIPVDDGEAAEAVRITTGQSAPTCGWYNGRNDLKLHAATTVSREVRGVRNHRFVTLLLPLLRGGELPQVERLDAARISVTVNGRTHLLNINELNMP